MFGFIVETYVKDQEMTHNTSLLNLHPTPSTSPPGAIAINKIRCATSSVHVVWNWCRQLYIAATLEPFYSFSWLQMLPKRSGCDAKRRDKTWGREWEQAEHDHSENAITRIF